MKVKVRVMVDSKLDFIPKEVLTPKEGEKIWLTVNSGKKPPITCNGAASVVNDDKLGLWFSDFYIDLGDEIEVHHGDILTIDKYILWVCKQ